MKQAQRALPLLIALLLAAACATTPKGGSEVLGAISAEVVDSRFGVVIPGRDGQNLLLTRSVPLIPGTTFGWALLLADVPEDIEFREVYSLPAPPREVTGGAHQSAAAVVEREGHGTNEEGWLVGFWTLDRGDPPGRHVIDIYIDDTLIHTFEFEVQVPRMPRKDPGTAP